MSTTPKLHALDTAPDVFDLTVEHITLLRASYVDRRLSDVETGAAWIDPKRPYGNSDVYRDVCELLNWAPAGWYDDDPPWEMIQRAMRIHSETPTALQIVLATGLFKPGHYVKTSQYQSRSWKLA